MVPAGLQRNLNLTKWLVMHPASEDAPHAPESDEAFPAAGTPQLVAMNLLDPLKNTARRNALILFITERFTEQGASRFGTLQQL